MPVEALSTNITTHTSCVLTVNFNPNYIFQTQRGRTTSRIGLTPFVITKLFVRIRAGVNKLEVGSFFYITTENRIPRLSLLVVKAVVHIKEYELTAYQIFL